MVARALLIVPLIAFAVLYPVNVHAAATKGNNGCGTDTAIISCSNVSGNSGVQGTGLWSLLLTVINILTAGIGVVALAGLVYGAIMYTSAGGNPEQVKKARTIFTNIVIGIIAYAAMWALLNFIIPGGVL